MKAANEVVSPRVLSRASKTSNHGLSRGIRTNALDKMHGEDIIKIVRRMRDRLENLAVSDPLFCFSDFVLCVTAFGFKQPFNGDIKATLPSLIDWRDLALDQVRVDFAASLFNTSKPSVIFARKSKMGDIGELYGASRDNKPVYHPHALSDFGGFSVKTGEDRGVGCLEKLIVYSDIKNPFSGGKGFDYKTGYYGKHWKTEDLWDNNGTKAKKVNVSKA